MKGNMGTIIVLAVMVSIVVAGIMTQRSLSTPDADRVDILHAGSLSITIQGIGPAFRTDTGYTISAEGHGSVQAANMIKDGQRDPDIFISASPSVMVPLEKKGLADWWIGFATDELVIAYKDQGPYHEELDDARDGILSWWEVLSEDGFHFGRTDPELDPKGYRCIFMAQLAQGYYNVKDLKQVLLGPDRNPEQVLPEETLFLHLDLGEVDAIIAYRHEAVERGLKFIELPDEIDLGSRNLEKAYASAYYRTLSGEIRRGSPIEFAITIPNSAINKKGAATFGEYVLSEKGSTQLEKHGFSTLDNLEIHGDIEDVPPGMSKYLD